MKIATTPAGIQKQLKQIWADENEIKWTQAALIYALVDKISEQPKIRSFSAAVIAAAGAKIPGFSAATKVRSYYQVWEKAIEIGIASPVGTGSEIVLPSDTFDNYFGDTPHAKKLSQAKNSSSVAEHSVPKPRGYASAKEAHEAIKAPRVSSNLERAERILQEVNVMIMAESDKKGIAYQTLSLLKMQAENAVNAYKVAVKS